MAHIGLCCVLAPTICRVNMSGYSPKLMRAMQASTWASKNPVVGITGAAAGTRDMYRPTSGQNAGWREFVASNDKPRIVAYSDGIRSVLPIPLQTGRQVTRTAPMKVQHVAINFKLCSGQEPAVLGTGSSSSDHGRFCSTATHQSWLM
jgi:hypothetical protein